MKESKNIYELLNHMNINLEDYEPEDLNDMEKQSLKSRFRKSGRRRINFKKIGAIAAMAVLTLGFFSQTNLGANVYAAAESKIAEISYSIGKTMGIERDIAPYAKVVNQTVEDNGVEVKLSDVIMDKDEIIFSILVNMNKPVDGFRFNDQIFINGRKLTNYGATGSSGAIDNSDTVFYLTSAVDAKGIELSDDIDMKIVLSDLNYYADGSEKSMKGKWEFEFTANGKELMANTQVFPLDYSFSIDNQSYMLEEFRCNPVNQKIFGKIKGKSKFSYKVDLRGHDNSGNEVVFFLTSVSGEDLVFKYENIQGDLSDKITSLTLTPYAAQLPEKSGKMSNDYKQVGEAFTILLND